MADINTTGPSYVVRTANSNGALGKVVDHPGRDEALGDELYHQLRQLRRGTTFRLHDQFVREHTREAARSRLRVECGRDFVLCGRECGIVDAVEQDGVCAGGAL